MAAKVREVRPGIVVVHLPLPMKPTIVNVTLLRGGDGWALVDTGVNTEESLAALDDALATVGCAPEQLTRIVGTHHHPDHYGASHALHERTGATLHLNRAEWEKTASFAPAVRSADARAFFEANGIPVAKLEPIPSPHDFWARLYRPREPDVFIDDGDELRLGDFDVRVVRTPGHTPGHCVLHLPAERVMIAGDHLLPKITPHVAYAGPSVPNPLGDFLDSQRKIQSLDVDLVLPAHGGTFSDHVHRANQIIQHHHARCADMLDYITPAPHTAYEIAQYAFNFTLESPLPIQFPATFETLAHLEYLRHDGRVVRDERDGVVRYGRA